MREPRHIVSLDSKPSTCTDGPEGPWTADVHVRSATAESDSFSARWLAVDHYQHFESREELGGEAGYVFQVGGGTYYVVPEHDVDSIQEVTGRNKGETELELREVDG